MVLDVGRPYVNFRYGHGTVTAVSSSVSPSGESAQNGRNPLRIRLGQNFFALVTKTIDVLALFGGTPPGDFPKFLCEILLRSLTYIMRFVEVWRSNDDAHC